MSRWLRSVPFAADHSDRRTEAWEFHRPSREPLRFDVDVRVGKPLDVLGLKGAGLDDEREYASFLAKTAARLYGDGAALQTLTQCTVCGGSLADATTVLRVFGVAYVRCPSCGHALVQKRPTAESLSQVFAESEGHSAIYVDRAALDIRMQQVVRPKLDWCLDIYSRRGLGSPRKVVDVGAGGGHFLAGAAQRGFMVEGFEKSRASREFAKQAFGLALRTDEFTTTSVESADMVTFWGLLEYVDQPRKFLAAARRVLGPRGMLIVEVPRVDCLGTHAQATDGAVVARHMDPTSHINAFSDESLCTALVEEGFAPVAAWYFGMDAWELVVQAALRAGDDSLVQKLADWIPVLQKAADLGRQCDDIVVAAVPLSR